MCRPAHWQTALLLSTLLHSLLAWSIWSMPGPRLAQATAQPVMIYVMGNEAEEGLAGSTLDLDGSTSAQVTALPNFSPATAPIEIPQATPQPANLGQPLAGLPSGEAGTGNVVNGPGGTGSHAAGAGGNGLKNQLFGIEVHGQKVVFVLDRSCSMGLKGSLATACRELTATLLHLPADAVFQVILYDAGARPLIGGWPCQWMPSDSAHIAESARMLASVEASGSTRHLEGLKMALQLQPDVVFFLTDNADDLTEADLRQLLPRIAPGTTFHAIELTPVNRNHPEMPVQRLAQATGGTYRGIDPATEP